MVYKSRKETAKAEIEIGSKGWVCGCVCVHAHTHTSSVGGLGK